jgi:hypothetical protein
MTEATTTEKQTAEEKFIRLANKRGEKFKHQCKLLRNLATSYAYTINPALAEELLAVFSAELETVRVAWTNEVEKVNRRAGSSEEAESVVD